MKKSPVSYRDNCRGCGSTKLDVVLDLGDMPLAGGFLSEDEVTKEGRYPLKIYYCEDCGLVQVLDVIDPSVLFKNYFYVSSVITSLSEHFRQYAEYLAASYLSSEGSKVLEFGCNDGVLLQYLEKYPYIKSYGVDPSENVTAIARDKGFKVYTEFFDRKSAKELLKEIGKVDVVTGSNVFAHTDNVLEIVEAAKLMLKPDGVFIVEVHYLKDLLEKFQYDTLYHEHLCYYSVSALNTILGRVGMKLVRVDHLEMHGGGIRVAAARSESKIKPDSSVKKFIENEKDINLKSIRKFGKEVVKHRKSLLELLDKVKAEGKNIVGYGAPGRGTILLNYCGIGKDYLDYIVDVSPLRAGKLMPGVHVPIYDVLKAREEKPDYFLVLAWNYYDSIRSQEKELIDAGVKFILPLPNIVVE